MAGFAAFTPLLSQNLMQHLSETDLPLLLYWKVLIFDFIGGPLEPVLLQPARIYVNQFWENWFQSSCCPNWHTSFTTTLYLNTSEFRYLRWCTIKSHYSQEFHKTDWGQTWLNFLTNLNACESWKPQERHVHWTLVKQVGSSQFQYSVLPSNIQWVPPVPPSTTPVPPSTNGHGLPCWLMPRLQSRLCVVFAPFVSPPFPQRTRDNRQTSRSASRNSSTKYLVPSKKYLTRQYTVVSTQ